MAATASGGSGGDRGHDRWEDRNRDDEWRRDKYKWRNEWRNDDDEDDLPDIDLRRPVPNDSIYASLLMYRICQQGLGSFVFAPQGMHEVQGLGVREEGPLRQQEVRAPLRSTMYVTPWFRLGELLPGCLLTRISLPGSHHHELSSPGAPYQDVSS